MCSSNARKLFIFLEKGHVKSVQELTDNLKNLLSQKPDSDTKLVICYDCKDKLSSFNFSDLKNSVIKLTSVTPTDLLGKRIGQRFTNIEKRFLVKTRNCHKPRFKQFFKFYC